MRLMTTLAVLGVIMPIATPALAQRRVYYNVPAPTRPSKFHLLGSSEFAKALSVGSPTGPSLLFALRGPVVDSVVVQRRCPMPVLHPDSAKLERMPAAAGDTATLRGMPVARPACENPLRR